jgi:hypothetical protein
VSKASIHYIEEVSQHIAPASFLAMRLSSRDCGVQVGRK